MTKQFLDCRASQKENKCDRWMTVVNGNVWFPKGNVSLKIACSQGECVNGTAEENVHRSDT